MSQEMEASGLTPKAWGRCSDSCPSQTMDPHLVVRGNNSGWLKISSWRLGSGQNPDAGLLLLFLAGAKGRI